MAIEPGNAGHYGILNNFTAFMVILMTFIMASEFCAWNLLSSIRWVAFQKITEDFMVDFYAAYNFSS